MAIKFGDDDRANINFLLKGSCLRFTSLPNAGIHHKNDVPNVDIRLKQCSTDLFEEVIENILIDDCGIVERLESRNEPPISGYSSSTANSLSTWRVDSKAELPGHSGGPPQLHP
ncbi:hypothetical protein E2C01_018468 [Portunus trituberculatus]|uniref:Uncharacterized protein n=1 Tax=Portunus trituberculatus TaxID=210409 RepID=A0A5B7DV49_PORTR|nr:hypothetical protein [Portunus trituberculatus]